MKIRHGIIIFILLTIGLTILDEPYLQIDFGLKQLLTNIILILWFASLGLIAYLIIRTIFRTIKGAVTGTPQGADYRREAQRAITPKKAKQTQNKVPWEE